MLAKPAHLFCLLSLALTLVASPALSIEINDAGAEKLRSMLSTHLERYKNSIKNTGGTIITKSDIKIEQGPNYYAATLPESVLTTTDGHKVNIGFIAINATPVEKTDDWKMSIAIPTPITITNKENKVIQRLDIREQTLGGLWSNKLQNFSKLSAHYNDVKFTDLQKGEYFSINDISVKGDLEEKKEGLWSGPTKFILSGLSLNETTQKKLFSLGRMEALININDFSPQKKKQALDKLRNTKDKELENAMPSILTDLFSAAGDTDVSFNLTDLKFYDQKNTEKFNISGINKIQFGYKSDTSKEDKKFQKFDLGYNGLSFIDPKKELPIVPQQFNTSISIENFPYAEVFKFAEETVLNDNSKNAQQVAASKALNFLPQKLTESGTVLAIEKTKFGNNIYNVDIDGKIKASDKSMIGGVGVLNVQMTGLDSLMQTLDSQPNSQDIIQQLTIFKAITEQKDDKNIVKIELNEQGSATINGKDMSSLMGLIAPTEQ